MNLKHVLAAVGLVFLASCSASEAQEITARAPVTTVPTPAAAPTTTTQPIVTVEPTTTATSAPVETTVAPRPADPEPEPPTTEPEPIVPPTIGTNGPEIRPLALSLPASDTTKDLWGVTVHVVAWYGDDRSFIFERADGTRALVVGADRPAWSYVYDISTDPCVRDFFNGDKRPAGCPVP